METYEKNIGLITVWRTFIRRWKVIIVVFVPIALASFVVTKFIMPKSYQSTATMLNSSNLDATKHSNIQAQITKSETLQETVSTLASLENPISINGDQILKNLTITPYSSSNPGVVTFSFKDSNKNIVQPVLKALSEAALAQIKVNGFANMTISKAASSPSDVSNSNKYLLIGIAAGAVLALGMAFVDEIISDEVYDRRDVELLGSPSFEITASKSTVAK